MPFNADSLPFIVITEAGERSSCLRMGGGNYVRASCDPDSGFIGWYAFLDAACSQGIWNSVDGTAWFSEGAQDRLPLVEGDYPLMSGELFQTSWVEFDERAKQLELRTNKAQ